MQSKKTVFGSSGGLLTVLLLLLGFQCSTQAELNDPQTRSFDSKFVPADGRILLFVGQDSDTIGDYIRAVPEDPLEGVTLYTQLKSANPDRTLKGLFSSANWRSGDVDFGKTLAQTPGAALAIGLALDQCNQPAHNQLISEGKYDASLKRLADYLGSLAPRRVFLRIGYEFDGPWNCYQPKSYVAAFRHISLFLKQHKLTNVTTVWQSANWPDPTIAGDNTALYDHRSPTHLQDWYPGDDVVDWVSMSVFYRDLSQWNYEPPYTPDFAQQKTLDFARAHNKPVMIAEAAPQAYRIGAQTHSYIMRNEQTPHSAEHIWRDWFVPFFQFIDLNKDVIRAVAYINTHWESQQRWYCAPNASPPDPSCPEGNWGDSRVQAHPFIKQQWLRQIKNPTKWVQSTDY